MFDSRAMQLIICARKMRTLFSDNSREKRARRQKHARRGKCALREKYMIIEYVPTSIVKHWWFSGRIVAIYYLRIKAFLPPIPYL